MSDIQQSRLRRHLPSARFSVALAIVVVLLLAAFIWFGVYNIAADSPHTRPVFALLDALRDRSIVVHAGGIRPPADLEAPPHASAGAGLYAEMCQGCHLGPGVEKSEISQGLYPPAPELAKDHDRTPAEQFWVIKHGVKLTAMPAWGKTHSDPLIWDLVAFLQVLPSLDATHYKAMVASAPADHDAMMKEMPKSN